MAADGWTWGVNLELCCCWASNGSLNVYRDDGIVCIPQYDQHIISHNIKTPWQVKWLTPIMATVLAVDPAGSSCPCEYFPTLKAPSCQQHSAHTACTVLLRDQCHQGVAVPWGVCWVCRYVWGGGGCFVSLDIHTNSRICGFPAEYGTAARWLMLFNLTVNGLISWPIGTEEGY